MILDCQKISKSFSEKAVLKDVSFHIEAHEKTAVVGINGAGKSTLLKIITGEEKPDEGEVIIAKDVKISYLSQHQDLIEEMTIKDAVLSVKEDILQMERRLRALEKEMKHKEGEALSPLLSEYDRLLAAFTDANGYALDSEVTGVLKGLGFTPEQFDTPVSTLSGGQKTRVALGRLLLFGADLLLLDEPTNHLDVASVEWLEGFLSSLDCAVLIVSHDRYFLDRIVTKVVEIDHTKGYVFSGNYSAFREKKEQLIESWQKTYENQMKKLAHEQSVIDTLKSFNREKSIRRAESREKMLAKVEVVDKPDAEHTGMKLAFSSTVVSGKEVITCEHLKKSFGDLTLFTDLSFQIRRGEHVAIIGENGTGKSTLLKLIMTVVDQAKETVIRYGLEEAFREEKLSLFPDEGTITIGSQVMPAYYDQEQQRLNPEATVFEEIAYAYPDLTDTAVRNCLAAFLFSEEDVFKKISNLSGGERARVSLAKLMLQDANLLILDEPTNHLDIVSKDILENAIRSYPGTVLFVSHDRYFINRTATRILSLKGEKFYEYLGNYDYYLEKRDQREKETVKEEEKETGNSRAAWQENKEKQAKERKNQRDLQNAEKKIAKLEEEIEALQAELSKPENARNAALLMECQKSLDEKEQELLAAYEIWEKLS